MIEITRDIKYIYQRMVNHLLQIEQVIYKVMDTQTHTDADTHTSCH